ncbi:two-component sensor histidine kinase [Marinibactrum halimedae]|uniref:histidine kinase n=2 Tax=Marinibactrum halimedae TaxID=1444977 RepID=A0AA37T5Y3_9GAMM|nr:two-component sensor histidine kinase [Marinibactrum halimedae]
MKIQSKLVIALACLGSLLCVMLYAFMQWSFDRGMINYVNQQEQEYLSTAANRLAEHYSEYGSWENLNGNRRLFGELLGDLWPALQLPPPPPHFSERRPARASDQAHLQRQRPFRDRDFSPEFRREKRPPPKGHFERANVPSLLDANKSPIFGRYQDNHLISPIAVSLNSENNGTGEEDETLSKQAAPTIVGWLSIPPPRYSLDKFNLSMGEHLEVAFVLVGLVLMMAVLFIGVPLSRHFVNPLQQLAKTTYALTRGQYPTLAGRHRHDEIGQLWRNIASLRNTLQANETERRRWVADISHELRTPLAIAIGEVDAMLEDVRPLTKNNLMSLKQEVLQLNRLVNDLYELTNAEIGALRYNKTKMDVRESLIQALQRFEELMTEKNLQLDVQLPNHSAWIHGDVQRFNQLMNNLFTNELKYCNPNDTIRIALTAHTKSRQLEIIIEDSGPGVDDEDLSKLFDHIYRVENSRNKNTGGSGLGLAICEKIVKAHDGIIRASHSPLGGLRMTIQFPSINR